MDFEKVKVSRRGFVAMTGAASLGALLAACGGGEDDLGDRAVRAGRGADHEVGDPGGLRRKCGHQDRGGIGGHPAGDVEAGPVERHEAFLDDDAVLVVRRVPRPLAVGEPADPTGRGLQSIFFNILPYIEQDNIYPCSMRRSRHRTTTR